jgi:hypothetical protein
MVNVMGHSLHFRPSFRNIYFLYTLLLGMCFLMSWESVYAQGISSDARDFYIGYMPGIRHGSGFAGVGETYWVLIGSYQNNNTVTVSYFGTDGKEFQSVSKVLNQGQCAQIALDRGQMGPDRPGEVAQYKAAHIQSQYPVSVQCYQEGSSTGGMYQAIPTSALGKSYVIASWFDNPLQDNPGSINRDSSSSEFLIIAAYDNTQVSFVPNATTNAGAIGVNSGAGHTGQPHPVTISLNRGQVYWVRSHSDDIANDLSGSTVFSSKPIAVLGGQERALLGDPTGYWTYLDNDIRDVLVEQMTPVEDWEADYPSIPTMPAPEVPRLLKSGEGDMYRIFTNDPNGVSINLWQGNQSYPRGVNLYQSPAATYNNIANPVDLLVSSLDSKKVRKKVYAVMYQYFQGQHDVETGGGNQQKGGTPQSNGGDQTLDETTYRCPNEMDLIPYNRFKLNTVFKVPFNSDYHGYEFINIITNKDSVSKIFVQTNGGPPVKLSALPTQQKQYTIPLHPELTGLTYQLAANDYLIYGNTPFACYSYGRTQQEYKDGWGYAAPTGEAYGTHDEKTPPRAQSTPACDHWNVRVFDDRPGDEGIADVLLLNDPNGFYAHPPHASYNVSLNPPPVFTPGDTGVSFTIQVNNATQDAYAAILVEDRAGNDTVFEYYYKGQNYAFSATSAIMSNVLVGTQACSTFSVRVLATGATDSVLIAPPSFAMHDGSFSVSSVPQLPATMKAGDSVVFTVCFNPVDTLQHTDSLVLGLGCLDSNFKVKANGVTPIIYAADYDFGSVPVGDTVCHLVRVKNIGNGNLIIDTNWLLHNIVPANSPEFSFSDDARLPDTVRPGKSIDLNFCFHPTNAGSAYGRQDWGTNLVSPFLHQTKDTSMLLGYGIEPGLNWDRRHQGFTVECDGYDTVRVYLVNPSLGTTGADITVTAVSLIGPDAKDFTVIGDQYGYAPPWSLGKGDSIWVDLQFHSVDLGNGYAARAAQIVALGSDASERPYADTMALTGIIRHTVLSVAPPAYDFGAFIPGQSAQATFLLCNGGDTTLVFTNLNFTGSNFTILSQPKTGDTLAPGTCDSVVVEYTAPAAAGISQGTYSASPNDLSCDTTVIFTVQGVSGNVNITGTGHDYGTIYICRNDSGITTASNLLSTKGAILDTIQIVGADSGQFTFSDGSRLLAVNQSVAAGDSMNFTVKYTPTYNGAVNAQIVYIWTDTSMSPPKDTIITRSLTGTGYQTTNTVSVQNPNGGGAYTAATGASVTIPVQLIHPFDSIAGVYGMTFTVRYKDDLFINPPSVSPINSVVKITSPIPLLTDLNGYDALALSVSNQDGTPLTNLATFATITLQYVVAKDSTTPIEIEDLQFLDKTGASVCWVQPDTIPSEFAGTNLCGDYTIRIYMKTGAIPLSIDRIVPNPVTNVARIDYEVAAANTPITIEVFNALGQKVATIVKDETVAAGGYQAQFDASTLPSGMYMIRFGTPGYEATKSILVNK